jgi:hypothetical protein
MERSGADGRRPSGASYGDELSRIAVENTSIVYSAAMPPAVLSVRRLPKSGGVDR